MMKKIAFLFVLCFLFVPTVMAETMKGQVTATNGLFIRKEPTSTSEAFDSGYEFKNMIDILDTVNSTDDKDKCGSKIWYKVLYEMQDGEDVYGYVCSNFVKIITEEEPEITVEFEKVLLEFPESYRESLINLHNLFPKATFVPINATWQSGKLMTFDEVVSGELIEGKNLLWDCSDSREGWKLLSSYDYNSNSFKNDYPGGGSCWYAVNKEILSYYLDPRNFLTEENVFMFESLGYFPNVHKKGGVENILKGSFMYDTFVDKSETVKFSDAIMDAGRDSKVSPYFIASRIRLEVGSTRSSLVKGTYSGDLAKYNGYYNFYNINASGPIDKIVENGLKYAMNKGWNSEYKAIVGGASVIGGSYISLGQNTLYLQKFDIDCDGWNSCLSHQYQQSVEGPYSEGRQTYNAYQKDLGQLMYNQEYVFVIPVYQDMPTTPVPRPSTKSPINYLSSLVVNGKSIPNFTGLTQNYNLTVPAGTTNLAIEAKAKNSNSKISGTGNIEIKDDSQVVSVVVTAENGSKREYKINVTRLKSEADITLEEVMKKLEKNFDDKYIVGLTTYERILEIVHKEEARVLVEITDTGGEKVTSGSVGTGYKVTLTLNEDKKTFDVIIYGDTNGDGEISILDLLRIQKHLLKSINMNETELKSSDINKDGKIDVLDLLLVRKHLLGVSTITQ